MLELMSGAGARTADLYLRLGRPFAQTAASARVRQGKLGQCYRNAALLCMSRPELAYCEGYAQPEGLIAVHHAWCIDEQGNVSDSTWGAEEGNEYFGVALDMTFVLSVIRERRRWGVLCEHLSRETLLTHPSRYLHPRWQPAAGVMDAFHQDMNSLFGR